MSENKFLPICKKDMEERGWEVCDFIIVTGDAYIDHHSFGTAVISRVLENAGYKVGIISQPNWNKIDDFKKEKGLFKLLSVGRFDEAKGFDNAIKALRILHDRGYKNIKWYVIGYGRDEELLKNLIKENNLEDSFILLGKKVNPYPYMKECDLYVQPSRYEGKAVTVTEAQILGKAVMITNYTTAKSQLKNGQDGYITDLSIEGIADGIEKLYKDEKLRKRLEENCKNNDYINKSELDKLYKIIEMGM